MVHRAPTIDVLLSDAGLADSRVSLVSEGGFVDQRYVISLTRSVSLAT
jgi:hypothetical protein